MVCVLIACLFFPAMAGKVISNWVFQYLIQKQTPYARSAAVVVFIASFVAVFFLTAYILTAKFRLIR